MNVCVYDHDTIDDTDGSLIDSILDSRVHLKDHDVELVTIQKELAPSKAVSRLKQEAFVVAHFGSSDAGDEAWVKLLADSPRSATRIRTSTKGRKDAHSIDSKGRVALYLRIDHSTVGPEGWVRIISALKDHDAAVRIVRDDIPSELRTFFAPVQHSTLLPALAILCQGYLAAKAEPGGESKNAHLSDLVNEAIKKIGWYRIAGSSLLKPSLRGEDEDGLNGLRSEVELASYWTVMAELDGLVDKCAQEWLPAGTTGDLEALKKSEKFKLITALDASAFPIEDSEMVANAYLALHEKLGGPSESAVAG